MRTRARGRNFETLFYEICNRRGVKHLTWPLPKNELLCFYGKGLDFLYGSSPLLAKVPLLRFLLSGSNLREECRYFSALWGIMVIEPSRFPLPLIYEAVARGAADKLKEPERDAVRFETQWACRPLQVVLQDLAGWSDGATRPTRCGPRASQHAAEVMEIQEQIGADVLDQLGEMFPDWMDELCRDYMERGRRLVGAPSEVSESHNGRNIRKPLMRLCSCTPTNAVSGKRPARSGRIVDYSEIGPKRHSRK